MGEKVNWRPSQGRDVLLHDHSPPVAPVATHREALQASAFDMKRNFLNLIAVWYKIFFRFTQPIASIKHLLPSNTSIRIINIVFCRRIKSNTKNNEVNQ